MLQDAISPPPVQRAGGPFFLTHGFLTIFGVRPVHLAVHADIVTVLWQTISALSILKLVEGVFRGHWGQPRTTSGEPGKTTKVHS